ncbi:hypothetical protein EJD97_022091 [Solanum chilense]|uniref:Uncharacterized protein n=1 Tax=Solanum chilense TaxID=4083 RepID=A0A6N2AWM3_SOLCI|nr:hypothetical protein EJD97_022091 [Solanum chilense]
MNENTSSPTLKGGKETKATSQQSSSSNHAHSPSKTADNSATNSEAIPIDYAANVVQGGRQPSRGKKNDENNSVVNSKCTYHSQISNNLDVGKVCDEIPKRKERNTNQNAVKDGNSDHISMNRDTNANQRRQDYAKDYTPKANNNTADNCCDNDNPSPETPLVVTDVVTGWRMEVMEKPTNLQVGDPKGMELVQYLATTNSYDQQNSKPGTTRKQQK